MGMDMIHGCAWLAMRTPNLLTRAPPTRARPMFQKGGLCRGREGQSTVFECVKGHFCRGPEGHSTVFEGDGL